MLVVTYPVASFSLYKKSTDSAKKSIDISQIVKNLKDPKWDKRMHALRDIIYIKRIENKDISSDIMVQVAQMLMDESMRVRMQARSTLRAIAEWDDLYYLMEHPLWQVRAGVLLVIATYQGEVPAHTQRWMMEIALRDVNWYVRLVALEALEDLKLEDIEVQNRLPYALKDPVEQVKIKAVQLVGMVQSDNKGAHQTMLHIISDSKSSSKSSWRLREQTVKVMGKMHVLSKKTVQELGTRGLNDTNIKVRLATVDSLVALINIDKIAHQSQGSMTGYFSYFLPNASSSNNESGSNELIYKEMVRVLKMDKSDKVRLAVAKGFQELAPDVAFVQQALVTQAKKDSSRHVRAACLQALNKMDIKKRQR